MRNRVDSHRSWVVRLVIGGIGVLYVGRLGYLQLSNLQAREKAQFNTIRRVEVLPPRGIIRDRHGRLWVHNKPFFPHLGNASPDFRPGYVTGGESF
jgi:cell division protein FtsI/penicillin-binding protein 2